MIEFMVMIACMLMGLNDMILQRGVDPRLTEEPVKEEEES